MSVRHFRNLPKYSWTRFQYLSESELAVGMKRSLGFFLRESRIISRSIGAVPLVLIHQVDAEYSEEALAAKREGKVILDVDVDPTGHVVNSHVVRALGVGLDEKAIEAVRQWRYRPALKDGQPMSFPMQIEFNFRLGKK